MKRLMNRFLIIIMFIFPIQGLSQVPVGAVIPFLGDTCPNGYLSLDQNRQPKRIEFSKLFEQAKTVHGAGDGVTTFGLPNLSGLTLRASGHQSFGGYSYGSNPGVRRNHAIENITGEAPTGGESWGTLGSGALRGNAVSSGSRNEGGASGRIATIVLNASWAVSTDTTTHPADYSLIFCVKSK